MLSIKKKKKNQAKELKNICNVTAEQLFHWYETLLHGIPLFILIKSQTLFTYYNLYRPRTVVLMLLLYFQEAGVETLSLNFL